MLNYNGVNPTAMQVGYPMIDQPEIFDPGDPEQLRARILGETAKIPWTELQRHFARGAVIMLRPQLDLVEVAMEISSDNRQQVEDWMADGDVRGVSDEQAQEWLDAKALMWAVVIKPWILIQPILNDTGP
jgi:hypothetical protein